MADTVRSHPRPGSNSDGNLVAAPLSHCSNPNSTMAGRRREDDENLVVDAQTFDWQMGGGNDKSWGGKARSWIHDKPGRTRSLSTSKTLALYQPNMAVRRLTPTECERLQALPDGWTNPDGTAADSRRYAALGDAVTASVSEWIGRRLAA